MSTSFLPLPDKHHVQSPYHTHDCTDCQFIALIHSDTGPRDLYLCRDTALLRRSSEPSDYSSWPLFMLTPQYMVAHSESSGFGYCGTQVLMRTVLEAHGVRFKD